MGAWESERETIGNLLASFTAAPLLWPNAGIDPPEPTAAPAPPVAYVAAEVEIDRAERSDFGGGAQVEGRVVLEVWAERRAGDGRVRSLADTLCVIFASADGGGVYFREARLGPAVIADAWYGRSLQVPFTRFREGVAS